MIVADYNQAELRAAAVIANEPTMLRIYQSGADLHRNTAASLALGFSEMTAEDQAEARNRAKAANFGLLYGMGVKGFRSYAAKNYDLHLSEEEATAIRDSFFALYPRLAEWHTEAKTDSQNYIEYGQTLLGRKRRIHPQADMVLETWCGFQALTNHRIQGSCADMLKIALNTIHRRLDPKKARLVGTVHDEIIVTACSAVVESTKLEVKMAMEEAGVTVFGDALKFVSEVKNGHHWGCK
jgi:DNA polymerase I